MPDGGWVVYERGNILLPLVAISSLCESLSILLVGGDVGDLLNGENANGPVSIYLLKGLLVISVSFPLNILQKIPLQTAFFNWIEWDFRKV